MKNFASILVALIALVLLAAPAMALPPCPEGISNIYQYSVATSPVAHHAQHQTVVANANNHCDAQYGSNSNYMGARITLNSACTSFSVYCQVCTGGGVYPWEYPMALSVAMGIADGATGGNGGVVVGAAQTTLDRFGRFVPGFLVEYVNADGTTGVSVAIDAETGEADVQQAREVAPQKANLK